MPLAIVDVLLITISLTVISGLLKYTGLISGRGLGVRLLLVSASFLVVSVGFELLSQLAMTNFGGTSTSEQIESVGIYIGYSVGGVTAILSGVLVALKSLLGGGPD